MTLRAATAKETRARDIRNADGKSSIEIRKRLHRKPKEFPSRNSEEENKIQHASVVGTIWTSDAKPVWEPQRRKGKGQKYPN